MKIEAEKLLKKGFKTLRKLKNSRQQKEAWCKAKTFGY